MEYENIIYEMDFLGEGAADLCAGEFLVPLASGPPASSGMYSEGGGAL